MSEGFRLADLTLSEVMLAILIAIGLVAMMATIVRAFRISAMDRKLHAEVLKEQELRALVEGEKNRLSGEVTHLFGVKEELRVAHHENAGLREKVNRYEAEQEQRRREFDGRIGQLDAANQALRQEQERLRVEEEERKSRAAANRSRIWKEHENRVIAQLKVWCEQPHLDFKHHSNANLPAEFSGDFKPDFFIKFLDSYVLFDAKFSGSGTSLRSYLANTGKKTADRAIAHGQFFTMIFFVVPGDAIEDIEPCTRHDGVWLCILSLEAVLPVLHCLRRIQARESLDAMDGDQREALISLLVDLDSHLCYRNGTDILLAAEGARLLRKCARRHPDTMAEVDARKVTLKPHKLSEVKLRQLMAWHAQQAEIDNLTNPAPEIEIEATEPDEASKA